MGGMLFVFYCLSRTLNDYFNDHLPKLLERYKKGRIMQFTFLKAAFISMIIIGSNVANAGIIEQWDVDFTESNFKDADPSQSFENSPVTVFDNVLTLSGNSWYYLDLTDAIGQSSINIDDNSSEFVLSFDFMTLGTQEIGGIQLSSSIKADVSATFNLVGTQSWAIEDVSYEDLGNWSSFEIKLDDYLSGSFNKIMFINDCDKNCSTPADVSFRNMQMTKVSEPSTLAILAFGIMGLVSRRFKK